jgi:hypothetical protein
VIFLDELAFMPPNVIISLILPLLPRKNTSIITATSMPLENLVFEHLMNAKNPMSDEPIFSVVKVDEVCKACRAAGTSLSCMHKLHKMSGNKSVGTRAATLALFPAGNRSQAEKELLNVDTGAGNHLLKESDINKFINSMIHVTKKPRCIYIGIDPGGGGLGHMGLCAIAEQPTVDGDTLAVIILLLLQME